MGGKKTELMQFDTESGRKIELPVSLVVGDAEGPDAAITAGLHGGDNCSLLTAIKLFRDLSPADVRGSVKIVSACCSPQLDKHCVLTCEKNEDDLSRSFPGKLGGTYASALAARIFDEIKGADFHIDLCCGGMLRRSAPFALYHRGRKGELNDSSHEIAYYFGLPNIVITETDGRRSDDGSCYASVYEGIGIPSVMLQIGGLGVASAEAVNVQTEGIKNVLRHFGVLRGAVRPVGRPQIFENMEIIHSRGRGVYYRRVNVGESVRRGQMIALLTDYFGEPIEKIISPVGGRALILSESAVLCDNDFVAAVGIGR